jgi:CRP-like cAMP-binding protein
MNTCLPIDTAPRQLQRGETLEHAHAPAGHWQLRQGLLLLESGPSGGGAGLRLVLPGDWLCAEALPGLPPEAQATALVSSQVQALDAETLPLVERLRQALRQQQRAADHLLALRTGPVERRLEHLGVLLHQGQRPDPGASATEWPALRQLARLIDAAPETVCRALARLRPPRAKTPARLVLLGA